MNPQMRLWMACAKEPFRHENKDLETMVNEQRKAILEMGKVIDKIEDSIFDRYENRVMSDFASNILDIIKGEK